MKEAMEKTWQSMLLNAKENANSESEFIKQVTEEFRGNAKLHEAYIFNCIHIKISRFYNFNNTALIPLKKNMDAIMPKSNRIEEIQKMESSLDLIMPSLGIKKWIFIFVAFIFPLPIYGILWNTFPVIFDFLILDFPFLIVVFHVLIVAFLFFSIPSLFDTKNFPGIRNLRDFINEILKQNLYMFWIADYKKTKELLSDYWKNEVHEKITPTSEA